MTFNSRERSVDDGAPIELYQFQYGPEEEHVYRYTNCVRDIGDGPGGVYKAIPISREVIRTTGKMERTSLNIKVPITSDLANLFLPYPPPRVVRVTMWQRHLTDPDRQDMVVWAGRILSNARQGNEAVLSCDNTVLSMKRQGLRRKWQHGCPYLLFGPDCGADKSAHRRPIEVVGINADGSLQFPVDWFLPYKLENFRSGTIEWTTALGREYRTIIDTGDQWIKIGGFLREIEAGTMVDIYPGCGHDMTSCREIFNNINQYGGQDWIPFKNPTKQHPFW
jgi:hypothetical protein